MHEEYGHIEVKIYGKWWPAMWDRDTSEVERTEEITIPNLGDPCFFLSDLANNL